MFSKTFYLFVDGEKISAGSLLLNGTTFKDGGFIGAPLYQANYYKGVLDDIRIYDKALSENEVTQLYQLLK